MSDLQNSDNQLEGFEEGPAIPPEKPTGGGRPFVIAITVIGVLLLVALVGLGIVLLNKNPNAATDQAARQNAQNTQIAAAATEQVRIAQLQQTVDAAKIPTATLAPTATTASAVTNTSVVAVPTATETPVPPTATLSSDDQTKTAFVLTKPVGGIGAGVTGSPQATSTALPTTGFADQAGIPGMIALTVLLLAVILVVRRMRVSTGH
jgi:flagellar basal body-associated protein FliL